MAAPQSFPVVMTHPQYKPAETWVSDADDVDSNKHNSPARYPPVTVNTEDQEAMYRARGYLRYGESMPKAVEYSEFPLMMWHPNHVEAIPPSMGARMENGQMIQFTIAGTPEKLPPMVARDEADEERWQAKGYERAGKTDELAFEKATVSPGEPGDEWPKWVEQEDGSMVLMGDPDTPADDPSEFPKWINFSDGGAELANDAAHEKRILAARGSSKHEPVKKVAESQKAAATAIDAVEWEEFKAFQAWKAAQAAGATQMVAAAVEAAPAVEVEASDVDDLRKQAAELGIDVDKRWGSKTLQREIDTALNN